ncbi:MAG: DNA mismatch repair protein MutS, partial [Fidelibacterota bacterium]
MKQFWEAKSKHPDTLILFRMGDFYETFEKDAQIASEVLGITLTKRANGAASTVPLAGFPYHALDQYLHKLLRAGHRVAICEQVEDPKLAKGIVKRDVVEVVTPGTAMSEKFLDQRENNYLISVQFNQGNTGISILDFSTGEFLTGEPSETELENVLRRFNPSEILFPESQESKIKSLVSSHDILLSGLPDWIFDFSTAFEVLKEHFKTANMKGFGIEDYHFAISTAGAVIHYVKETLKSRTEHITSVSLLQDDGYMCLDTFSVRNLEIFKSLATQGLHGTLISVLDKTITAAGGRRLKQILRRPVYDKVRIENRFDQIQELLADAHLRGELRKELRSVSDIDRIVAKISTNQASPRDVCQLGISLSKIPVFSNVFTPGEPSLKKLMSNSVDTSHIVNLINDVLTDDPPVSITKGKYIRAGFNAELDEYREISEHAGQWVARYQTEQKSITGIPSLKIGFNKVFGYYIEVTKAHMDKVPDEYIRKQTLTNSERYFTPELKEYEEKILSADQKIIEIESRIFDELKKEILKSAKEIQANAGILARLDVAASMAEVADRNDYIRPEIVDGNILELKDSRHPVVETLLPMGEKFIPNDVELVAEDKQIGIITGPNMAGKSTYIRQVGLIVLMVQCGSFVPASKAKLSLVDKLFTRVGASDNLAGGESTFLVEMNETANILNNTTKNSLILLDEIGRGTSTYDGLSIAWAVTEYLHNKPEVSSKTLLRHTIMSWLNW